MKKVFPGHYTPSSEDFELMWKDGIFIFDTNFLLDLYRYSDDTVQNLLTLIEKIKDRIWIPYRVAFEYHRRLNDIIKEQAISYSKAKTTLKDFKESFEKKRGHPFFDNDLHSEMETFCNKFYKELADKEEVIKKLILENPTKEKLSELFEGRIGAQFTDKELEEIYIEGADRYKNKIPPGYKDKNDKTGSEIYGDLIIWKEILNKAKQSNSPIVFVTGDVKEDWFLEVMGLTIGPRPELVQEIKGVNDILFHIYSADSFFRFANNKPEFEIKETALNEIKEKIEESRTEMKKMREVENETLDNSSHTESELEDETESFQSDEEVGDIPNEDNQSSI